MKRILLLLATVFLVACSSNTEEVEEFCWKFRIRVMTIIEQGSSLKSTSEFTEQTHCGMTKQEAEDFAEGMELESISKKNGVKVTIKTTVINISKVSQ